MLNASYDLEIVTFNVRGLHNFSKRKDVFHFLRRERSDIICLQELHIAPGEEHMFKNQWGGMAWFSTLSSTKGGVGILINNKTGCKAIEVTTNNSGNAIFLTLEINDTKMLVVNVYGPPHKDDPSFYEEIFYRATVEDHDHVIICGDWNLTLDPEQDTYNYALRDRRPKARCLIRQKCSDLNLHDVWRIFNGDKKQFSWRKDNPVKCARLDFFLISESMLSKTVSCDIMPAYRSDHSRVVLRIKLNAQARGRGFWKLNCSLLKDLNYLEMVKRVIQDTINCYACLVYSKSYVTSLESRKAISMTINDVLFLETLIMKIRSHTVTYSIRNKKRKK